MKKGKEMMVPFSSHYWAYKFSSWKVIYNSNQRSYLKLAEHKTKYIEKVRETDIYSILNASFDSWFETLL